MKNVFVYPGCFTPPTRGHFRIVERAAEIFPEIIIVCSTNPEKDRTRWFSEEECKMMWQHYPMPSNVCVKTFTEYSQESADFANIVMIRGVRDENDMDNEKRVMKLNKEMFGIDKILYLLAEEAFQEISASKVRQAAQAFDFKTLSEVVPPAIITQLLEKVLDAKNLFMVVGRPGSGKSTFLEMLAKIDATNVHINTDPFSKTIKPLLFEKFGKNADLIALAIEHAQEMTAFVAPFWFNCLAKALRKVPKNSNVFLEIPYGLKAGKELYRYVGHKVLYVGCANQAENHRRLVNRGTEQHARFADAIPGLSESRSLAEKHQFRFYAVDTSTTVTELQQKAEEFAKNL
ncbi:MAG: adenylyltransferase/cytidyltransferase family protein [Parcubacteria group bacterium]|jgi:pantetheine-phosphate adenylyltransferase